MATSYATVGGAQSLDEEAGQQQHGSHGEEGQGARDRAELREVVQEQLAQADGEEGEASEAQGPLPPRQADEEQGESESAPECADRGVTALEVGVQTRRRDADGQFEDRKRDRVDGDQDRK